MEVLGVQQAEQQQQQHAHEQQVLQVQHQRLEEGAQVAADAQDCLEPEHEVEGW